MKRILRFLRFVACIIFLFAVRLDVSGATITATATGAFTAPTGSVVNVGLDVNNNGTFTTGATSVANITGSVSNVGTFNGGAASLLYIGGNASNSGTLNTGTNTIIFNGSSLQTLTNTGAGAVNNITINNTSDGLQLLTDLTVPNTLDMTQGNIDLTEIIFLSAFRHSKKARCFIQQVPSLAQEILNAGSILRPSVTDRRSVFILSVPFQISDRFIFQRPPALQPAVRLH